MGSGKRRLKARWGTHVEVSHYKGYLMEVQHVVSEQGWRCVVYENIAPNRRFQRFFSSTYSSPRFAKAVAEGFVDGLS